MLKLTALLSNDVIIFLFYVRASVKFEVGNVRNYSGKVKTNVEMLENYWGN